MEECISMVRTDDGSKHKTWDELTKNNEIPDSFDDERAGGLHHYVPEPIKAFEENKKSKHYKVDRKN